MALLVGRSAFIVMCSLASCAADAIVRPSPVAPAHVSLDGYSAPTLPLDVARSVTSPQTLLQSTVDHGPS